MHHRRRPHAHWHGRVPAVAQVRLNRLTPHIRSHVPFPGSRSNEDEKPQQRTLRFDREEMHPPLVRSR